jgi:polyisoprenyl-phosphate glycosyltransferase
MVIPCYNEEEVLFETSKKLFEKISFLINDHQINQDSKIMFINDGSKDNTWNIIEKLHKENPVFCGINLSKNNGHQNALLAGLMEAKKYADMVISLDADLQDDINAIDKFLKEYYNGSDIVYGVRSSRESDTYYKKTTAHLFYKIMILLGVNVIYNHADYRLMNKKALDDLSNFREVNLFLRGIVPLIGLKYSVVEYTRNERFAGKSKYPLKKMISFAWDGITSFSITPIRIVTGLGFLFFVFSIIALIYALISKISGNSVAGWTSLTISVWILGSIQLLSIGIIGEYIGKIYKETKQRPRFIISDILLNINKDNKNHSC